MSTHSPSLDMDPAAFEAELRGGADVLVIDTRDRDAFAAWHVDPAGAPIVFAPTLADVRGAVSELSLDEDAFVARVLGGMPPCPANYLAIIGVNLGDELDGDAAARLEIGANNCAAKLEWADGGASC